MPNEDGLQFKVTLLDVDPPVWRRIQVPAAYSFWDLHVAIQDAMGWLDYHLHQFKLSTGSDSPVVIGIPDDEFPSGRETLPGWEIPVARYLAEHATFRLREEFGTEPKVHYVHPERRTT